MGKEYTQLVRVRKNPNVQLSTPNRRENDFFIGLMVARHIMSTCRDAIRQRMKQYKYGWRDVRLLEVMLEKVQQEMMDTIPDKRLDYYEHLRLYGKHTIEIPGPIPRGSHRLINHKDLEALIGAAMGGMCCMCIREGREITECRVRQALLSVAPPDQVTGDGGRFIKCEYQEAASALVDGQDIFD